MILEKFIRKDIWLVLSIVLLTSISLITLGSIAPYVFPTYFVYIIAAVLAFMLFARIDFDLLTLFSWHFYIGSIIFLIIPLLIGQVTRGVIRWIPIGPITIQPAELVRPFLLIFFANFLTQREVRPKKFLMSLVLLALPLFLILIQPSLGVTVLTFVGFIGILLAADFRKKNLLYVAAAALIFSPVFWFLLAPYQKERVTTFLNPANDPSGAGYNSIQSMISIGSGKIWGRGLGQGVQTQLSFLPERHTDFIFASFAEELGLAGGMLLLLASIFLLYRVIKVGENSQGPIARAFISGVFLTLFVQTVVHIGMNMGLLPITGVPLPLVSAGGSSLVGTMIMLGMVAGARKRS